MRQPNWRGLMAGAARLARSARTGLVGAGTHSPLLDAERLRQLALAAQTLPCRLARFERAPAQPLLGEVLSAQRGRGYEFEENRPYQPGDETRALNWRLYARAGQLFTKVFTEERRPEVCLLVDRRAPMRFATRGQLKAALAAEQAVILIHQARHQALAVGGLILDEQARWLPPAFGDGAARALIDALAAPCPPQPFDRPQVTLSAALHGLLPRLAGGAHLALFSDFADFDPATDAGTLQALATRHTVQATQILDPVELALPTHGECLIDDPASDLPLVLNGADTARRDAYAGAFAATQAILRDTFAGAGAGLRTMTTDAPSAVCGAHSHGA